MESKDKIYEIIRICTKCSKEYKAKTTAPELKQGKCFECFMSGK